MPTAWRKRGKLDRKLLAVPRSGDQLHQIILKRWLVNEILYTSLKQQRKIIAKLTITDGLQSNEIGIVIHRSDDYTCIDVLSFLTLLDKIQIWFIRKKSKQYNMTDSLLWLKLGIVPRCHCKLCTHNHFRYVGTFCLNWDHWACLASELQYEKPFE